MLMSPPPASMIGEKQGLRTRPRFGSSIRVVQSMQSKYAVMEWPEHSNPKPLGFINLWTLADSKSTSSLNLNRFT